MCNHEKTICPNHNGGYDCTPFCRLCEGDQEFCAVCLPLTIDDWDEFYKPTPNFISEEGTSFETYGDELAYVATRDVHHVWTEIDGDNGVYLINGFHYVNRIQYYLSEVPWHDGEDLCITVCEYVVCSCYNPDDEETEPDEDCQQCYGEGTYTDWK